MLQLDITTALLLRNSTHYSIATTFCFGEKYTDYFVKIKITGQQLMRSER